jgi:hypothetical protein
VPFVSFVVNLHPSLTTRLPENRVEIHLRLWDGGVKQQRRVSPT